MNNHLSACHRSWTWASITARGPQRGACRSSTHAASTLHRHPTPACRHLLRAKDRLCRCTEDLPSAPPSSSPNLAASRLSSSTQRLRTLHIEWGQTSTQICSQVPLPHQFFPRHASLPRQRLYHRFQSFRPFLPRRQATPHEDLMMARTVSTTARSISRRIWRMQAGVRTSVRRRWTLSQSAAPRMAISRRAAFKQLSSVPMTVVSFWTRSPSSPPLGVSPAEPRSEVLQLRPSAIK